MSTVTLEQPDAPPVPTGEEELPLADLQLPGVGTE